MSEHWLQLICISIAQSFARDIDKYLWPSQFSFKRTVRVIDSLFMARRHIDDLYAKQHVKLCLLAFDWANAFDNIMPQSMIHALQRFCIPNDFLHHARSLFMIPTLIRLRTFSVLESVRGAFVSSIVCHSDEFFDC